MEANLSPVGNRGDATREAYAAASCASERADDREHLGKVLCSSQFGLFSKAKKFPSFFLTLRCNKEAKANV